MPAEKENFFATFLSEQMHRFVFPLASVITSMSCAFDYIPTASRSTYEYEKKNVKLDFDRYKKKTRVLIRVIDSKYASAFLS